MLEVQVCYALLNTQTLVSLKLPIGTTLHDAIEASKIMKIHPKINLIHQRIGVFGCIRALDSALEHGDRVEIYRSLIVDPKLARQRRIDKDFYKRMKRVRKNTY
ncbi:RnfH family protein [Candidatus Vallotia cooleyia]|uniref:RnfH family protein n=1 Tax=Candidatus Vallotiella adelgis TaxID=1177211 RepID=UPI001D016D75|nr:RnfH family protein [Candidatus Vallotia cooleyia]